jgi:hypothetical protein
MQSYKAYIEEQILSGKSRQEVYNDAVTIYDVKIHDIAEAIRKTPSLIQRAKCKTQNEILLLLLLLDIVMGKISRLEEETYIALAPSLIMLFLLYGLYNFKYPAHLFATILLFTITIGLIVIIAFEFSWGILLLLLVTLCSTVLVMYINRTISSDYTFNREIIVNDPEARVDVITFHR